MEPNKLLSIGLAVLLVTVGSGAAMAASTNNIGQSSVGTGVLSDIDGTDNSTTLDVNRSTALETATVELGSAYDWTLVRSSVHEDDGYYRFRFALQSSDLTGEAEVRVDGSSGDVFRTEKEIEVEQEDENEQENEDEQEDENEQENEDEQEDENEQENEDEQEDENEQENEDEQEDENEQENEDEQEDENEQENEDEQEDENEQENEDEQEDENEQENEDD
ncbi:hypothetical protein [Halobaculum gomorrense]|uniref:hypothetical protein n=1 Tax=Halobaculum gomorrense TaxID=43928 RepID=UPI000934BD4B|nr:hypothetical protein [Halobaculum gomorrense]